MTDINFIRKLSNLNNNIQPSPAVKNKDDINSAFKELLDKKISRDSEEKLVFSKHAAERIKERNIEVSAEVEEKLSEAAEQAKEKGLKNVLVMMENHAFIINTLNKKVITAVDSNDLKENIFTNIDGAVIK